MKHTRALNLFTKAAIVITAIVVTMMPGRAAAQAVLNPGVIKGNIAVIGETVTQATITADWIDPATGTNYSARTSISGAGSYSLTVNVPGTVTAQYSVSVTVRLSGAQSALALPDQFAAVTAFHETVANFVVVPGYITAIVTPTSGSLTSLFLTAFGSGGGASQGSGPGASITFPVLPDAAVSVFGTAIFTTGFANLPTQTVAVGEGETVSVSWTAAAPAPPGFGSLTGTFAFTGAAPEQTDINATCGSTASTTLPSGNGSFSFPGLISGPCTLSAASYFNSGNTSLFFPDSSFSPGRHPLLATGGTTNIDIAATAGFLDGTVALTGATTMAQTSALYIGAYGAANTLAEGGSAATSANPQTGAYHLVLTPGGWSPRVLDFLLENPDPAAYLQEYLTFFDTQAYYEPTMVSEGQTATKNLTYETGKVTVSFRVAGGGTLSNPALFGSCVALDENGQETSSYNFSSYGNQVDVALGRVTFVGMAGTCSIEAYADVDDANTRFGALTIEVKPRTEVEVDLDGPTLTVTFPPVDHVTSDAAITVTGFAIDDVGVATVTVNGVPATLTGPATLVNFSFPLALSLGANQIVTVATDTDGLTASDTRTVYRVEGSSNVPPAVSLTGPTNVPSGSTKNYSFTVTDPDAGATFTVTSVSCGANGSQVGATTTTATGGSFSCAFSGDVTSTLSVQVTDNAGAPSNLATLLVTVAKAPTTTVVTCPASVAYTGVAQTPCSATVTSADGLNQPVPVTYTANVNVGTATASAAYPGDVDHKSSSDSETFAISKIATTTVVTCPASVNYTGAAHTPCTALVTSADGLSQSLTVTHSNNVNAGTANASAAYAGDGNHNASNDSETFAINPIASTTVVTCPVSVGYTGAAHTPCTAVVTSADGLNQSLTVTYANNINVGTATANASYSGDANHAASNDSETFAIGKIATTTVVTCPASVNYTGVAQTPCTALVTSADGLSQSLTVTHSNNVNAGTANASAAYAGDTNHNASNGSATFAINPLASTTVVTCPVSVGYTGAAHTPCTAVVTSADGFSQSLTATHADNVNVGTASANAAYSGDANHAASNGSKTFAINAIPSVTVVTCPISVSYSGAAQTPCTATVTSADGLALPVEVNYTLNINVGTATASATYAGDANHGASSHTATFAITPLATTTVVTCPASVNYTGAVHTPCTAKVTAADGLDQSLSVTYTANLNAGTATGSAAYAGDANHAASSGAATFAINPLPTTTVVTCPVTVYYDGSPQTPCSAKVTSVDALNLSPMVSYVNNVNPGTATASASYAGDGNHSPSSGTTTFAIEPNATKPTTTSIVAPTITYAANGAVTVTVTAPSGTVTGNVSLKVDGGAPQTKPLSGGSATFTVTQPNAGSHALSASYAAQGTFGASTATGTLIVNQSPTATTLTSSPNPSSQGQLVTLTAVVVSVAPGSGVPVGTVTFKDGATVLGTKPVSASGQAVLTTSALTVGPHTLTATYSGNANYKPSSGTTSHLVFAYATGGGTFAIGDVNSAVGAEVTFWGAQWWKLNSLSGVVYAPAAFKGYITTPLPSPPVVGGTWKTDPGNSSNPPATIPAYLAVVITSSTTKSGSLIAGNVVGLAIVRTDAGYAGNPGHEGSGTIVAVIR